MNPYWGFANHASSWRRRVWASFRFDERMTACEDKEWSWRVLRAGYTLVYSPDLVVAGDHRRQAGLRGSYERNFREARELAKRLDFEQASLACLASRWWHEFPGESRWSPWVRRGSPHRAAEMLGRYRGERSGFSSADRNPFNGLKPPWMSGDSRV